MMNRFLRIILPLLLSSIFLCVPAKADIDTVYVYNNEFSINPPGNPVADAVITQGDSIRWLWVQGGHTTTAVAGSPEQWDHPINSSNTEFIRAFPNTGVFVYYCIPHGNDNGDGTASGMSGTITVLAAGSGACCLPDGTCVTTSEGDCVAQDGLFSGTGTLCDTTICLVHLEITADKDNTLYESETGALSNGLGDHLWTGNNSTGRRRPVISFNLESLPAGAIITSAELQLYCNNNSGSPHPIALHKLTRAWGEGTSDANGNEGSGATSTPGDATWIHAYYDTTLWTIAGGDFLATASDTTTVGATGSFSWNSPGLLADVQSWAADSTANQGWVVLGDETTTSNSKRFSSVQNGTADNRPRLILEFYIPSAGACCLPDGSCETLSESACAAQGGAFQGPNSTCGDIFCPIDLTPYVDALPLPAVASPVSGQSGGAAHYRMVMTEQFQQLHSELPPTRVWGYNGAYPGPTIEAFRDSLVTVRWVNDLRHAESGMLREHHVLHIDTCLHGPNMTGMTPVAVVHLHGGKVAPHSDGYPDDAFPPGDSSTVYEYPNIQAAGTIWYHDHALGITRLNVMMGLAGLYLIRDSAELALNLPSGEYEIPLVVQDRSFHADGSIRYPEEFHDHFFGEKILVNGKVWPYHHVKQGQYRLRLVNGSNSRAYTLHLSGGLTFTQIGSDLGLLDMPVVLDSITMLPGERYDVVVDFSGLPAGTEIFLSNSAPAPFPGFPGVGVVPEVMKFIVDGLPGFSLALPDTLVAIEPLLPGTAEEERLFELLTATAPACGEHMHPIWTINGLLWDDITEFPVYGSTEIWTWHNQSGIGHPMHMHLVGFQILDRQAIDEATGLPIGPLIPPDPQEKGWKDTANSPPGYRTRVIARFDGFTGLYPYHCHILEHEDHEMMRQFEVRPCNLVTNTDDNGAGSLRYAIDCVSAGDTVFFAAALAGDTIHLTDSLLIGKIVTMYNAHANRVAISAAAAPRLLHVGSTGNVHLEHLTLISGTNGTGRAILNEGGLRLHNVTVADGLLPPLHLPLVINHGTLTVRGMVDVKLTSD